MDESSKSLRSQRETAYPFSPYRRVSGEPGYEMEAAEQSSQLYAAQHAQRAASQQAQQAAQQALPAGIPPDFFQIGKLYKIGIPGGAYRARLLSQIPAVRHYEFSSPVVVEGNVPVLDKLTMYGMPSRIILRLNEPDRMVMLNGTYRIGDQLFENTTYPLTELKVEGGYQRAQEMKTADLMTTNQFAPGQISSFLGGRRSKRRRRKMSSYRNGRTRYTQRSTSFRRR